MAEKHDDPESTKITSDTNKVIKEKIGESIKLIVEELPKLEATFGMNIHIPSDYFDLLKSLEQETNLDELAIIKQGLIFVALATRVKKQGYNLAVVDNEGNVITNVSGY